MINKFNKFNEGFAGEVNQGDETYKLYELLYYAFDWDDNILNMPTEIVLLDAGGNEVGMSTADFAEHRSEIGKVEFDYNGHSIVSFAENPFRNFRDEVDPEIFVKDVKKALDKNLKAKSWDDFIECLTTGSLFAIITARGHEPEPMRKGVELIISQLSADEKRRMIEHLKMYKYHYDQDVNVDENKLISDYLDVCEFIGVSAPSRGGSPENPEKAKEDAFMGFVDKCNKFAKDLETRFNESGADKWKVVAKIGFSDDDSKNVKHINDVVKDLHHEVYSNVKEFVVKDTGKQEIEKNVYTKESRIKNFKDFGLVYEASVDVISSLPNAAMSGGMNSQDPYVTRGIQQGNFLAKLSKEIFGKHESKRRKKK